jgi:membrane protease subunit HflC
MTLPDPPSPDDPPPPARSIHARRLLLAAATGAILALYLSLSGLTVGPHQAVITTQFGRLARVITAPGPTLTWPAPFGRRLLIDTREHVSQTDLVDIATADGQQRRAQAFAIWRIPPDERAIRLFARATLGPGPGAAQVVKSMLETALSSTAAATKADALLSLSQALKSAVAPQAEAAYGIEIEQAGLTQLTLPEAEIAAAASLARAKREADATNRLAEARAQAAEIHAEAERDARTTLAEAQIEAANIEAAARKEAAEIEGRAYNADPDLYQMLRSLDTLSTMVGPSTRLVLRTDAAPFNVLVQGPPQESITK